MIQKDKNKNVLMCFNEGSQKVHWPLNVNVLFYVLLISFINAIDISSPNNYQGPMLYCCFNSEDGKALSDHLAIKYFFFILHLNYLMICKCFNETFFFLNATASVSTYF